MGGGGQLVVVLLSSGPGGASADSCTLMVLAGVPFGGMVYDVFDVAPNGVLDGALPLSSVLLGF